MVSSYRAGGPRMQGRLLEWGVMLCVVLLALGVFGYQSRQLQVQAERAMVLSTLGSLRTSLVLEHVRRAVQGADGGTAAAVKRNPFQVLPYPPANYAGEKSMSHIVEVPEGSWIFDPVCPCIGYRVQHGQGLEPAREPLALWFRVSEPSGMLELQAAEPYRWQGQPVH